MGLLLLLVLAKQNQLNPVKPHRVLNCAGLVSVQLAYQTP